MTLDAIAAFIFAIIIITAVFNIQFSKTSRTEILEFRNLHYASEDALDVLNKRGILDQIATY
ncbi:MAG: hypothetical protein DRO95_05515, partial [Candidatus Altiarchaeales archaeon]